MAGRGLLAVAGGVLLLALAARGHAQDDRLEVVDPRPAVPELRLRGIDGGVHDLAALRGRVVLVNFWATWCPPCIEELPSLQRLWDAWRRHGLEVLAVNVGEEARDVETFLAGFRPALAFPVLLDEDGDAFGAWRVFGLPTTFVVDRQGRLAYHAAGPRAMDSEPIRAQLAALFQGDMSQ